MEAIMEIPQKLIKHLVDNKVTYEVIHHAAAFTAERIAAAEHVKGHHHAKVVITRCAGKHLMTVLPADCHVDLEKLEKVAGMPVWIENEAEFQNLFPDCDPGAMPPFGDLYGLPTFVDQRLNKEDYIVFQSGNRTHSIKISYADYERVAKPHVADFAVKFHPDGRSTYAAR
jgi:Ala-tRNA(Pro) deacylase